MTQRFDNKDFISTFENDSIPKLLYISKVDHKHTSLPRAMHMHQDVMEIIFIKEGKGSHTIGGRHYKTQKGDILIYNNSILHNEYANPDSQMSVYCCGITNLKISGLPKNHLVPVQCSYVLQSKEYATNIESLLAMMYTQISLEKHGKTEICSYLLRAMITLILQIPDKNFVFPLTEKSILEQEIKSFLDDNYFHNITLNFISQKFHVSPYYLVHIFKEFTGYSPIQYIIQRRIGEAQSLLINTNESITNISCMVGYDNTSYFTTLFSKTVGISPKKYRQLWKHSGCLKKIF